MYQRSLISVIIPIYNISDVLPICLKSIISSTYKNLEIICINDGSTDNSLSIIEEYMAKDNRIILINKDHGGVSEARNYGLQIATGEYISFVDGDDYINPNMYEILLQAFFNKEIACVKCDYSITYETNLDNVINKHFKRDLVHIADSSHVLKLLLERGDSKFKDYVWNGLYKHELIKNHYFIPGKKSQDAFWSYRIYGESKKIVLYSDSLYYYFQRINSISHEKPNIKDLDNLDAKTEKLKYILEFYPSLEALATYDLYSGCMNLYINTRKLPNNHSKKVIISSITNKKIICQKKTISMLKSNDITKSQKFIILLSLVSFRFGCSIKHLMIIIKEALFNCFKEY